MRAARRAGTNAAATPTTAVTAAMASERHRVDVRAIHVHVADPDVRRSGRRAQREHDQDREDETDARANADQPRHPSRNAPDHLLTPGAERHPDADLARPPRDRKRDDRIETDARQHQTEAAEGAEQRGDHLRRRLRSFQILRHRLRRDHRQRDVHGAQLALHRPDKGGRITRRSRDDGRRQRGPTACTSGRTGAAVGSRTSSARDSACRCRGRRR